MNLKYFLQLLNKSIFFGFFICLSLLGGCHGIQVSSSNDGCSKVKSPCLQGKATVKLATNRGEILLEIDGDAAPVTAGNFIDLVSKGVYEGTVFHRVIKEPQPFVIQGGDPFSKEPETLKSNYGKGNFIDLTTGRPRFIPLEIKLETEEKPRYRRLIVNPSELSKLQLSHQRGSLSMARSQDLDSASAQFYIALRTLPELDGRYAVFGRVVKGMDVVDRILQNDIIFKATFFIPENI